MEDWMADVVVDSESKNPKELYGQGLRAFVLEDYSAAASALSKASELLVAEHGDDLHESLGEVYLYYGKALLWLSREESEALGDAVPRNEESSEEDNAEDTEENGGNTAETNENNENEAIETDKKSDNDEKSDVEKESTETVGNGSAEGTSTGATKGDGTDNDAAATETEEEPTDLQVAWEVLELAKRIFQKQGDFAKKNLAETLVSLGEVSLESENFESAINDINEGLKIQKEIFAKDSRTVAETLYKLGMAYSTDTQIDEAINSFNNSLEYLNNRIAYLEKVEDNKDVIEEEIKQIKSIIPDLQEKVTDMKTYKDEALKNIVSAITEVKKSDPAAPSSSSSKPATNISHLVKRKRKSDETGDKETSQEENPPKKVNQ